MTALGCDYAWQHPDPAALAAAGYHFACRYLSHDLSKNMTAPEVTALAAHGIATVSNFEDAAKTMLGGFSAGVSAAQMSRTQATAAGMPTNRPIYFSADWDATPADQGAINAFLDGAASVIGGPWVGIYGGYWVVKRALDAGHAVWAWQTLAWSGGQWDPRAHLRQTGRQPTIGGVQVDDNIAMQADYGQWTPGSSPPIGDSDMTPEEHGMLADIQARVTALETLPWNKQNALAWHLNAISQGHDIWGNAEIPSGLPQIKAAIDALPGKITAATVDVKALASALAPLLPSGVSADTIATAVVVHLAADLAKG